MTYQSVLGMTLTPSAWIEDDVSWFTLSARSMAAATSSARRRKSSSKAQAAR